ncbi:MAG: ECF transporter S component [Catonella sp.]
MNTMYTKTGRLVGTGILTALIIVLQTFASGIKIANFTPPLSLIPIITGAILFGEFTGAILGFVFGIVVVMTVISGAEPFSTLMLNFNPVMTVVICLLKGTAAGYLSGLAYKLLSGHSKMLSLIISSIITPIVNTGIFTIGMLTVFYKLINDSAASAGADNTIVFFFSAFIGINFLTEVVFVAVLVPAISNIIYVIKKKK